MPGLRPASRRQAAGLLAIGLVLWAAAVALGEPGEPAEVSPVPAGSGSPSAAEGQETPAPAPSTPSPAPSKPSPAGPGLRPVSVPPEARPATVVRHVDGDTIWAEGGTLPPGAHSRVRLLEVDTPESTNRTDCYGPSAAAFTQAELPLGARIYLLADREDTDQFGRFLRYIWKDNGEFFNEKLVREGYARAVLYPPNDRYIALMRAAEAEARAAGRGLWSACSSAVVRPAQAPLPPAPQGPAPQPPAGGGCDPSYSGVCIAPSPPDLDCPDIPHRRFQVHPPDPHRFDADGDGIGCESG